jgi:hypothetical protein
MTELAYSHAFAPRSSFIDELKEIFRATPLAIFAAALQAHR